MLSDGYLIDIGRYLQEKSISGPQEVAHLRDLLTEIYSLDSYQEWLREGQYHTRNTNQSRFVLPKDFGISPHSSVRRELLDKYFLANGFELTVKIDQHRSKIHLTDGNWIPSSKRVYPYLDESESLLAYAERRGMLESIDLIIDPACGCGHHAIGTPSNILKANFDINPRALAYCSINSILANQENMLISTWDVRRGIHPMAARINADHVAILVNMPFAIFPRLRQEFDRQSQDGGERGIALTRAALQSIADFIEHAAAKRVTALVLCYTLGPFQEYDWEIEKIASLLLPNKVVNFSILSTEKQWRVNGRKEQPNPMSIHNLKLKSNCNHSYSEEEMPDALDGYNRLIDQFTRSGFREMAYGILQIEKFCPPTF